MKQIISCLLIAVLLSACGVKKKVLIMSKGTITVNGNNISIEDENNYAEKEIDLSGSDKTTLNITGPTGNFSVDVPGAGFYILNVRKDTLLGAYQKIGRDLNSDQVMTQEDLLIKIDSLHKMIADSNISAANKNYFITQNQLQKITDNINALIVGPFQLIPNTLDPGPDGKGPELYKFFTSAEMRDMIDNDTKATHQEN